MPRKLTTPAALLSAFLLSGCGTGTLGTNLTDTSCRSFKSITHSKKDTEQTRREVIAHNKVFDTICPEPKGAPAKVASANG
jgi:hypothetical protein